VSEISFSIKIGAMNIVQTSIILLMYHRHELLYLMYLSMFKGSYGIRLAEVKICEEDRPRYRKNGE
jgi:hypothetical protein